MQKASKTAGGRARRSGCPVATSLDIFGDKWSLLVVRDILFGGPRSYREFLASDEQIATNVLAERLDRLECEGIVERLPDPADGRKATYDLTEKGLALAPVLLEMASWAARYEKTAAPPAVIRRIRDDRDGFVAELRRGWQARR